MRDISKLPKWAQEEINSLREKQTTYETGASIEGCHIENNGIKHDPETVKAITAIAEAMGKHSEALRELSKSVSGSGQSIEFGSGIQLSDVRHS